VRYIAEEIHLTNQPDLALCFYRVAQEALNNSMKHSRSTRVDVTLSAHGGMLSMTIRDDGTGFDPSAAANGLGLATMRERMRLVEGRLRIDSHHGKGTEVSAKAPMGVTQPQLAH
jgi:signal transduction histidine kinase